MPRTLNSNQVGLMEHGIGHYMIEASTFELKPGEFPTLIETNLGNKLPFGLVSLNQHRAIYRQDAGILKLTIFND